MHRGLGKHDTNRAIRFRRVHAGIRGHCVRGITAMRGFVNIYPGNILFELVDGNGFMATLH